MSPPALQLSGISVRAGGKSILDGIDFDVAVGETVALLGPNGAGKSTLLHVAGLLRRPDAGSIAILGQLAAPRQEDALRRQISVVFQSPLLFNVNVLTNAAAGLRFQGVPRQDAERRARRWLEQFGVEHLSARRARSLSGGEASRVALARAFATEPAILLLDEPFSALDAPTQAALLPELRQQLRDSGAAAVLVTHDLHEAFAFGDRLALMREGRLLATGDARQLLARPPSRAVAELLGIETVLPARVVRRAGDRISLELQPHGPIVEVVEPGAPVPMGRIVTVTLSAAACRVLSADGDLPSGWNALPGQVTDATPTPTGTRVTVATPAPLVGLATWDAKPADWVIGACARLAFPPEAAHLIPNAN